MSLLKMPWDMSPEERSNYEKAKENQQRDEHWNRDRWHRMASAANDAAIKIGESTVRWSILINGATAGGLLTFAGTVKELRAGVASTLGFFAFGVVAGALSMGCAYAANFYVGRVLSSFVPTTEWPYMAQGASTKAFERYRDFAQVGAVLFFLISIALFVFGILSVRTILLERA